ncbi:MAG: potassium transporter TrkG, partial [Flavobacteriales bacterium]
FIGAYPSSTGGGIKTTTFGVIWASIWAIISGKKNVEIFNRTIDQNLALKAFSIFLFFILGILLGVFFLTITEYEYLQSGKFELMDVIFEEVSAFGTVGLSTGITSQLTSAGKCIIIISMFVGRVGTLTIAFLFGKKFISKDYKYPKAHTMVG